MSKIKFCFFGTPLEPLDEDNVFSRKPVPIHEQIVTDENGKRRFHGAFTGGFSAGYWNTVGSSEGWTPSSFKSSRSERAPQMPGRKPEDFMDDEDKGEFGIAPHQWEMNKDYELEPIAKRPRKLAQPDLIGGSIPGPSPLLELLKPAEDRIAVRILKSWGWKPGQGIGPRQTRKEKNLTRERNARESYLVSRYGFDPESQNKSHSVDEANDADPDEHADADDDDAEDDDDDDKITFARDDFETDFYTEKNDKFGLGYKPLCRDPVLSDKVVAPSSSAKEGHIDLFTPLELLDKNNKKISIRGHAFGVGALEEEDDDIYAGDDMSKYDFSLNDSKPKRKKLNAPIQEKGVLEGFERAKNPDPAYSVFKVEVPANFRPRNWLERKSRFEPLDPEKARKLAMDNKFRKPRQGERNLTLEERQEIWEGKPQEVNPQIVVKSENIDEPISSNAAVTAASASQLEQEKIEKRREEERQKLLKLIGAKSDKFTSVSVITKDGEEIQQRPDSKSNANVICKTIPSSKPGPEKNDFKPFLANPEKQARYEKFLATNLRTEDEIKAFLATIQPINLSEYDREMERKEFIQARKMFRPLEGIMSDRFISETTVKSESVPEGKEAVKTEDKQIIVERTKVMWKPDSLLCKRYNIPEPFGGTMIDNKSSKKKGKLSVFDYIDVSANRKEDFQTPIVIPKSLEEKPRVKAKPEPERIPTQTVINDDKERSKNTSNEAGSSSSTKQATQADKSQGKDAPIKAFVPKTDLEKRVVETFDLPLSEKVDLFRAIFDFSESESEDDKPAEDSPKPDADHSESTDASKLNPTIAVNLLRNNSPPRGIFAALFGKPTTNVVEEKAKDENDKSVDLTTSSLMEDQKSPVEKEIANKASSSIAANVLPAKITFKSKAERSLEQKLEETDSANVYGPQIPVHIKPTTINERATHTEKKDSVDDKIIELLKKTKSKNHRENEIWVEKSNSNLSLNSSTDSPVRKKKKSKPKKDKDNKKKKSKKKSSKHKHKKSSKDK